MRAAVLHAFAATLLLAALPACAAPEPCTEDAAYARGFQGLGPDPDCPATPQLQAALDRGFADGVRLRRLSTTPNDVLSGRRRMDPGVASIAPLEAPASEPGAADPLPAEEPAR